MPTRINWLNVNILIEHDVITYTGGSLIEESGGFERAAYSGMHFIEDRAGGLKNAATFQGKEVTNGHCQDSQVGLQAGKRS